MFESAIMIKSIHGQGVVRILPKSTSFWKHVRQLPEKLRAFLEFGSATPCPILSLQGGIMKEIKKGDRIAFRAIDFIGSEFTPIGDVIGFGEEARKRFPKECCEADDDVLLVKSTDHGNLYIVHESEVLEIIRPDQKINLDAKRIGTVRRLKD